MKKNILKILLISTCCFSLCGCNQSIEKTSIPNTVNGNNLIIEKEPTEELLKSSEIKVTYEIGEDILFESNTEYNIDLNNDGIDEKILYYVKGDYESDENAATHLIINDTDYSSEIDLFAPTDTFHIIDIDKNDNFFELLVSTYGMSDDLESVWFRYDGNRLIKLGYTQMIPGEGITINDDSTLTIYNRTDIMETSFIPVIYKIENNKIVKVQEDGKLYKWDTFREGLLETKIDLTVRTDRNIESETIVIPKNSEVDSNTTDDIEWVNIIYDGTEYWLHTVDSILIDNNDNYTYDAFNNLFLAD